MTLDGKPCSRCGKPMVNRTKWQEICYSCREKSTRKRIREYNKKRKALKEVKKCQKI